MSRFPVVPAPRLLRLMALCLLLALLPPLLRLGAEGAWIDTLGEAAAAAAVALVLLALWDLLRLRRLPAIEVRRELAQNLPVNGWSDVTLHLSHHFRHPVTIELYDHHPAAGESRLLPQRLTLEPGRFSELRYAFRPLQRGPARFGPAQLLIPSPLGLWSLSTQRGGIEEVRVYPDFGAVSRYQLLAADNRASQLGIRRRPRRGEGLEFHQLRDYRPGDALRQIDWKASVRRQKMISKEYQDERDQQLFFMIDCGRRMRAQDGPLSHFDHSLNALLLLSHVALRQGDGVGLMSFGGEERWLAPQKTAMALNTILNSVYDLQPATRASDYLVAAERLLQRQRKRSLVVVMTNLRGEEETELLPAIGLLRRHHLVLVASLREQALDRTLSAPVEDLDGALTYLGACDYAEERRRMERALRRQGGLVIDTTPDGLAAALVNGYLEIKRARVL